VVRIAKGNEIGVISVVVLNQNAFILESNDRDLVVVVLLEGGQG
jgi:hypothetical protein